MKTVQIRLSTIPEVQTFINTVSRFVSDVDLSSGKYRVDAKSIMGIFSLNLMQPITLTAEGEDEDKVIEAISSLICE